MIETQSITVAAAARGISVEEYRRRYHGIMGHAGVVDDQPGRCCGIYEIPLAELDALPTLAEGQADSLKIESDRERVWLSRCTIEDGEPWNNKVTVERLIAGEWIAVEHWEATDG